MWGKEGVARVRNQAWQCCDGHWFTGEQAVSPRGRAGQVQDTDRRDLPPLTVPSCLGKHLGGIPGIHEDCTLASWNQAQRESTGLGNL